jgi:hypothetical protein
MSDTSDDNDDHPALEDYRIDEDYTKQKRRELEADAEKAPGATDGDTSTDDGQRRDVSDAHQQTDGAYIFATAVGDGAAPSIDDIIDENAVMENDGRSNTRTMFYASEGASSKEQQYRRLAKLNDGMYSPDRKQQNAWADKKRWVSGFCGYVGMSETSKERTLTILEHLNMKHMGPYSTEKVILAIMSIVSRENDRLLRDEEPYHNLLDDIETDLKEIRRVRRLVMEKSDLC